MDHICRLVAKAVGNGREALTTAIDLDVIAALRSWGQFRDRRQETCGAVATLDGVV